MTSVLDASSRLARCAVQGYWKTLKPRDQNVAIRGASMLRNIFSRYPVKVGRTLVQSASKRKASRILLMSAAGVGVASIAGAYTLSSYYKISFSDLFPSEHRKESIEDLIPEPPAGENRRRPPFKFKYPMRHGGTECAYLQSELSILSECLHTAPPGTRTAQCGN